MLTESAITSKVAALLGTRTGIQLGASWAVRHVCSESLTYLAPAAMARVTRNARTLRTRTLRTKLEPGARDFVANLNRA